MRTAPPGVESDTGVRSYASAMPNHETSPLLTPYTLGSLELPNRIAMAPMTRYRGDEDGVPLPIVADYYAQRAGAGLIVSEGIWPSFSGQSGWRIPGLVTEDQVRGWRRVTDAVPARRRRADRRPADARRPEHPPRLPDRRRAPAGPVPGAAAAPGAHPVRQGRPAGPRRDDRGGHPHRGRRPRPRRAQRDPGRLRPGGAARRQQLPDPPVPRGQHQPAHRRLRRLRADPVRRRGGARGGRGDRRGADRYPALPRQLAV